MKFSRWALDDRSWVWYRDPFTPVSAPVAAVPPLSSDESSAPAVPAAPFPPLPQNSRQKPNETIQAFFIRRREANLKKIANESSADRQRRTSRADNAKLGAVPKKASVFLWETQNGYWIRQPQTRGEFADLWSEYPGPERRFDPLHNEWDLCPLFKNNNPAFGEGFDHPADDDSDNEMDPGDPVFPQDIDMESRLPPDVTNMEVVPEQHPRDVEASIVDLDYEDLGPDFTESDIPPIRNLAQASRKCVNAVYMKFGLTPRTEKPEYESIAANLSDSLLKRFGFVMPSTPDTFVLLIPRATDLVEVIRQEWGPTIKDVAAHFVARGIPFWLAYASAEIMPASKPVGRLHPKGFKADTSSGLGFRPHQHTFDEHDYNGYTTQRDLQFLHTPRARIALQYGGVIARLARSEVSDEDFFRLFDEEIYNVGDCLWDEQSQHSYWYYRLSEREIDLLCGVYHLGTGM
ncbi:hypothetical protein B0H13DRAFT_1630244 [Mycena leptocephala]|nr:hypothetical protein B0H13DRAFT_1630244 [Mycena leptocephala]